MSRNLICGRAWRGRIALAVLALGAMLASAGKADEKVFGAPVRVGGVASRGMAVALDGTRLFAGAGTKLYAFDVSNPLKPVLRGELDGFDNLRQIRVRGDFVYVVSRETGMRIVDVSDPAHMRNSWGQALQQSMGIDGDRPRKAVEMRKVPENNEIEEF